MAAELSDKNFHVIDEILDVLKRYPEFELLWLKHEPVLSLPGLEIDPRKVWEEVAFGNANNAIACHVHNLREKIGRLLPERCFVIRCVREVGYCLETDSECIAAA